jgi:hypothetical protein
VELKPKAGSGKKSKSDRYREELEQQIRGLLEPDEQLAGIAAASWKKSAFSTAVVAVAVTDRRLLIQPLDRRGRGLKGDGHSLTREQIEKFKVGGGGGFGNSPTSAIMDSSTIDLKLWLSGGEKLKFSLMHGEGMFGFLGGGAPQQDGVQSLLAFLDPGSGSSI